MTTPHGLFTRRELPGRWPIALLEGVRAAAHVFALRAAQRNKARRRPFFWEETNSVYEERWPMTTDPRTTAQPLWFIDNLVYIHVDGEQSAGAYSLSETSAARGNMPPLHVHRRNDETFYILEGDVRLFVGDREVVLAPGQPALAPRGVPHTYRVESDRARWIVINSPAGYEQFLRAVSEPAPRAELPPAGRHSDPAALARAAAEQGIEILGPPGMLPAQA